MITQELKQDKNVIRIETAESLEDAEKNKFKNGEYHRFFINNKPVSSYMTLIKYIIDETHRTGKNFIPDSANLKKMRDNMIKSRNNQMKEQLKKVKESYKNFNIDESFFKNIDAMIDKIDETGIRVAK